MTTIELKHSIQHSIDDIEDENILKAIHAMVTAYLNGEIVGHIGRTPLTRADVVKREKQSDEDIKAGRVHTLDEVKQRLLKK